MEEYVMPTFLWDYKYIRQEKKGQVVYKFAILYSLVAATV
jgi:hypothetical protein